MKVSNHLAMFILIGLRLPPEAKTALLYTHAAGSLTSLVQQLPKKQVFRYLESLFKESFFYYRKIVVALQKFTKTFAV